MNSCAAISGFDAPVAREPGDLSLLRGEVVERLDRRAVTNSRDPGHGHAALHSLCDTRLTAGAERPPLRGTRELRCGRGVPFEPVRQLLLVYQQHGGPWDWSKGLRDQELFDEHARFLDGLVDGGFITLGGPLDERDVLLVVQGETEASVRSRLPLILGLRTAW